MDNEAILKYDQESFDHNDNLLFTHETNFLDDLNMNGFVLNTQKVLENIDCFSLNPTKQMPNSNNTSIYSTNCSSKNTPEHIAEIYEDSEDNRSSMSLRNGMVPKVKKTIYKKFYEPIFDNQMIYRYEENPEEYRKARKRLQNRESASRVRNRKRNQMEQVEDEIKDLKLKNEELMLYNASLTAENNLLKQQIAFLQKVVIKSSKPSENHKLEGDQDPRYVLPVKSTNVTMEEEPKQVRLSSSQASPTKHLSILGVFTIMIVILSNSFGDSAIENKGVISFSDQFRNQFDRSLKSLNGKTVSLENEEINVEKFFGQTFEFLLGQYQMLRSLMCFLKYAIVAVYAGYLLWILYTFVIKRYVKLKIKKI